MNNDSIGIFYPNQEKFVKEQRIRRFFYTLFALFVLYTLANSVFKNDGEDIIISAVILLLLNLPAWIETKLRCRISVGVYIFALFYVICPLLGNAYLFYYTVPWWDKFMHATGGIVLAMLGVFISARLNKGNENRVWLNAWFALFFSIALAAIWEFYEYAVDSFFLNDMQKDSFISSINSYLLGGNVGKMAGISSIESVVVNGQPLAGYIDVGLHDTMIDMLLESFCGLLYVIYYVLRKGKNPAFTPLESLQNAE